MGGALGEAVFNVERVIEEGVFDQYYSLLSFFLM